MKLLNIILIIIGTSLSSFGQRGYLELNIFDKEGNSNEIFIKVEFLDLDSLPINSFYTDFGKYEIIQKLIPGDYFVRLNLNNITTMDDFSYSREFYPIIPFSIFKNDTTTIEMFPKVDTVKRDTLFYLDLFDLHGEFYCFWKDCVDSNNLKTGVEQGNYCQVVGKAGDHYSIYVRGQQLLKIKTENDTKTYCYDPTDAKFQIVLMKPYAMKREEIYDFIKENFVNGKMKKELTIDGKPIIK